MGAERRLAEAHLNRVSASPALEDNNLLDGEEIRIRLILVAAAASTGDGGAGVTVEPPVSSFFSSGFGPARPFTFSAVFNGRALGLNPSGFVTDCVKSAISRVRRFL